MNFDDFVSSFAALSLTESVAHISNSPVDLGDLDLDKLNKLKYTIVPMIRSCTNEEEKQQLIAYCRRINDKIKPFLPKDNAEEFETKECAECKKEYRHKIRLHPSSLCYNCYISHRDDLLEVILPMSSVAPSAAPLAAPLAMALPSEQPDTGRKTIIFKKDQQQEAEEWLSTKIAILRLDLEGVCSLLDHQVKIVEDLKETPVCIISYVGRGTDTRLGAREDVIKRVQSGQVSFGLLLFERGREQDPNHERFADKFHLPGSKAWANRFIGILGSSQGLGLVQGLFVDDSLDHIRSVESLEDQIIICKHHTGDSEDLLKTINEFLNRSSFGSTTEDQPIVNN